jgi:hypothetical protein
MTDLLTLLEILRRRKWSLGFLLVLLWGISDLTGGERLRYMESSPDYFYRLEVYSPYRYQDPIGKGLFDGDESVFIRLYSNLPGNRFLGETPLVSDRESAITRLWDQWESGRVSAGMSDDEKDTEFTDIPPIDPATRQALPITSQRTVVDFSDPEGLERLANLDGNKAVCDAQQVVETDGRQYILSCAFYPPPSPRCEERPEGEAELCRIEAARNYETSYRMALFRMAYGKSDANCWRIENLLERFAGSRIARDLAWAYKIGQCGPYAPDITRHE